MASYTLQFPEESTSSTITYSLVELPPTISSLISGIDGDSSGLVIKGQPSDDAVLCTPSATYNIRSVQNSNSLLLCRPSKGKKVDIQTTLHQTLELDLTVPKLERITDILKGQEWSPEEEAGYEHELGRKRKRSKRYTREDILDLVPASDEQTLAAMRERRILEVDGFCRTLAPNGLTSLLKTLLNTLTILSFSPNSFPLEEVAASLEKDDNIPSEVTAQLVEWFGKKDAKGQWKLEMKDVAREIGKELLAGHKNKPVAEDAFTSSWQDALGDEYAEHCQLSLLTGVYLLNASKLASSPSTLTYFPVSSLPLDPASRFSELFSVRPRWKVSEMAPFLADLAPEPKKRDALTLKFVRKVKGEDGAMEYAARGR